MSYATVGEMCVQERVGIARGSREAGGLPYLGLEHIESETGRILGTGAAAAQRGLCFRFSPAHVLYGKLRPYLNKVALPEFDGKCSTEAVPLRPHPGIDRAWLALVLRGPQIVAAVVNASSGSRMPRADMGVLFSLKVRVPELAEQRRLVHILAEQEAHLAAIECAARAQIADVTRLRALLNRNLEALAARVKR